MAQIVPSALKRATSWARTDRQMPVADGSLSEFRDLDKTDHDNLGYTGEDRASLFASGIWRPTVASRARTAINTTSGLSLKFCAAMTMAAETLRDPVPKPKAHWLSRPRPAEQVTDSRHHQNHDCGGQNAEAPDCVPRVACVRGSRPAPGRRIKMRLAILAKTGTRRRGKLFLPRMD